MDKVVKAAKRLKYRTGLMRGTSAAILLAFGLSPAVAQAGEEGLGETGTAGFTLLAQASAQELSTDRAGDDDEEGDAGDAPEGYDPDDLIVVTGSRIRRPALANISPTISVDREELDNRGVIDVLDFLEELPALTGSESINDNTGSFGDMGVRRANLRGLGAYRTLTVVDNRRRASTASSFFGRNSFDWNVLPQNLIERVDVLTGGASSIYGSDAVTGVININLRDEIEGINVGANYFTLGDIGYDSHSVFVNGGYQDGPLNVVASLEYSTSSEVTRSDAGRQGFASWIPNEQPALRYAHVDIQPQPIDPNWAYDTLPFYNVIDMWNGRYPDVIPDFQTIWPASGYAPIDANGDVILDGGAPDWARWVYTSDWFVDGTFNPTIYDRQLGRFRAIDTGSTGPLNWWGCDANGGCELTNEETTYWSPTERYNGYLMMDYDLSSSVEASAELIYSHTESSSQLSSIFVNRSTNPLWVGAYVDMVDLGSSSGDLPQVVGSSRNPLLGAPLQSQLDELGVAGFQIGTRALTEFGPRISTREQEYIALALGLDGQLDNGWTWRAFYDYGRAEYGTRSTGQAYAANWAEATDIVVDQATGNAVCRSAAARAAGCAPVNIMNGLSDEAVAYISAPDSQLDFVSEMHQVSFDLSGDTSPWFELPAGPILFAVGAEYRDESNARTVSEEMANGTGFFGSQLPSFDVSNAVTEAFGEVIVPVLADIPGIDSLEFEGAYRLTQYEEGAGDILETYKYGFRWQINDSVLLRAVQARSIRAPHPSELGLPGSIGYIGYTDPCSWTSIQNANDPQRLTNCMAWTGFTENELQQFNGLNTGEDMSGGNPDLQPEISDTLTIGLVLQPSFIEGLWITVDYFDIELQDLIAQLGEQSILNRCALNYAPDSQYCRLVDRDPTTQQIQLVRDTFVNVNGQDIDGWDVQASYGFALADMLGRTPLADGERDLGQIHLSFSGQYLEKDEFIDIDGAVTDYAGQYWNPDVRLNGSLGYSIGEWRFNWSSRFFGATDTTASEPRWQTKSVIYHDASVGYYIPRGEDWIELRAGVTNVFDQGPRPHTWTVGGGQFDEIGGRGFWASVRVPFN